MVALDVARVGGTLAVLTAVGAAFPPELAVAYAASRVIRPFRIPIVIPMAALLAKAVPDLTAVRFSKLFAASTTTFKKDASYKAPVMPSWEEAKAAGKQGDVRGLFRMSGDAALACMDQYGLAYIIANTGVGVAILLGLWEAVEMGLPVTEWLESVGLGVAGDVAGNYAASVLISTAAYPVLLMTALAPASRIVAGFMPGK